MAIRTTVDIPEPLHNLLRHRAEQSGSSIRALIVRAIEESYSDGKKGAYVRAPMIRGGGKRGPKFPVDATPHELVFS